MSRAFTKEQVTEAIRGSGGIMSAVAKKLSCAWDTAKKYVNEWVCTRQAFENEREQFLDACESVLEQNVRIAMLAQKDGKMADTSDAKWVLSRLGKHRGYAGRQEVDVTSDGERLPAIVYLPDNKRESDND